jgi:hypothetical protein
MLHEAAEHVTNNPGSLSHGSQLEPASGCLSKTTPDTPAALPNKTGLPKIAKETARLAVGMIAATPYLSD